MLGFPFLTPVPVFGVNPMGRACRARAFAPMLHSRMVLSQPPAVAGGNPLVSEDAWTCYKSQTHHTSLK